MTHAGLKLGWSILEGFRETKKFGYNWKLLVNDRFYLFIYYKVYFKHITNTKDHNLAAINFKLHTTELKEP